MFAAISGSSRERHDLHSTAWANLVTPNLAHGKASQRLVLNTVTVPQRWIQRGRALESNLRSMDDEFYEDDFDDDEVIENAVLCPNCEDVTGHQIFKEKETAEARISSYDARYVQQFMKFNSEHLL